MRSLPGPEPVQCRLVRVMVKISQRFRIDLELSQTPLLSPNTPSEGGTDGRAGGRPAAGGFTVEAVVEVGVNLVNVLLEFGLSGHAAIDCRLGWFRDGSDGATLLLKLLLRVGCVEKPEAIVLWRHWFDRSLLPGMPSNSLRRCGGRHDGAEDAIFHKAPSLLLINYARSLFLSLLLCIIYIN